MSQTGELEILKQRIDATRREAAALAAAIAHGRRIRLFLLLGLVVIFAVTATVFYRLYDRVTSPAYSEKLIQSARKRLETRQKFLFDEMQYLVNNSGPVLGEAVQKQAKTDMPRLTHIFEREQTAFIKGLEPELTQRVAKFYDTVVLNNQELVRKEFGDLDDPKAQQNLVLNLQVAVQKLSQKYYIEDTKEHLAKLYETWEHFPPAEAPKGPLQATVEDQLIGNLLEMLAYKLTHAEKNPRP